VRPDKRADGRAADRLLDRACQVALSFIREGNSTAAEWSLLSAGYSAMMLLGEAEGDTP